MIRSDVRHALFRMKNGIPKENAKEIYDLVEPNIPSGESWSTFAQGWDVFVVKDKIKVIIPEIDYDFIHSTCLEKLFASKQKTEVEFTPRQMNVIQIVEINMLEKLMTWDTYNKSWGVRVDYELKKVSTYLFKTVVNSVTKEMIAASAKSDGAAMAELPTIPTAKLSDPIPATDDDVAMVNKWMSQNK